MRDEAGVLVAYGVEEDLHGLQRRRVNLVGTMPDPIGIQSRSRVGLFGLIDRMHWEGNLAARRHLYACHHRFVSGYNAVGLTLETTVTRRRRDPAFRQRVLTASEYRCALCGFDVRLGSVSIAIDAAHIRDKGSRTRPKYEHGRWGVAQQVRPAKPQLVEIIRFPGAWPRQTIVVHKRASQKRARWVVFVVATITVSPG